MAKKKDILPNLIIIGAMKCGSTSLHAYLDMHPEIQMSNPKELNFFSSEENYNKGTSWYHTFFEEGFKYNGESSINYTKKHVFKDVAIRMKNCLGSDVKLIYIVRDPIDRFQSNFTDSKTACEIPSTYSINKFIEDDIDNNPLLKTSMYYYQIEDFVSNFDLKNMYFLKANDLKRDPQTTMDLLFEFLDLETVSVKKIELNQSVSKTYYSTKFLKVVKSPLIQNLKRFVPSNVLEDIIKSKVLKRISKKKINPALDTISDENRLVLKKYLMTDSTKFEELTKIKF